MQMLKKNPGNVVLNVVVALGLVTVIVLNSLKEVRLKQSQSNVYIVLAVTILLCNLLCMKMKNPMLKGLCVVASLVLLNLAVDDVKVEVVPDNGGEGVGLHNGNRVVTLVVAAIQAVMCVSACCAK